MSQTVTAPQRLLVISMDTQQQVELARIAGSVLTGVLGTSLWSKLSARWRRKRHEPVELTARLIDDRDKFCEQLLEENRTLRAENKSSLERAHAAEIGLATARYENTTLQRRLERKDEQLKALVGQIAQLGQVPVTFVTPAPDRSTSDGG